MHRGFMPPLSFVRNRGLKETSKISKDMKEIKSESIEFLSIPISVSNFESGVEDYFIVMNQ